MVLEKNGFTKGKVPPSNFCHSRTRVCVIVHGDDLASTGPKAHLEWFKSVFDGAYGCKHHWLEPDDKEEKSTRILNTVIPWTKEGIKHETDQRHVEVVLDQLQLTEAKSFVNSWDQRGSSQSA